VIEPTPLRTDAEEEARAIIRLRLGNTDRVLPELAFDPWCDWVNVYNARLAESAKLDEQVAAAPDQQLSIMATFPTRVEIDLLLAYDTSGVLGGREWIQAHASPREIHEAFVKVRAVAFPFEDQMEDAIKQVTAQALIGQLQAARGARSSNALPPSTAGRRPKRKR
jgi:hypothetical protein